MEPTLKSKFFIIPVFKKALINAIKDAHKIFLWGFVPVLSFFLIVLTSIFLFKNILSSYAFGYIGNITSLPYLDFSQYLWVILTSILILAVLLMFFLIPFAFAAFTQKRRLSDACSLTFFECFFRKFFWKFAGFYALFYLAPALVNIINSWLWAVYSFKYYRSYDINPDYFKILSLIINLTWLFFIVRLALVFPLAIKEEKSCIANSWRFTKGYFWQIAALLILHLLFVFISAAVLGLLTRILFFLPIILSVIINVIIFFAFGFIALIVLPSEILCALYQELAKGNIAQITKSIDNTPNSTFKIKYEYTIYAVVGIILAFISIWLRTFIF